jgi:glycine/D-amino acid oxidase-like deaminating enzyme
VNQQNYDVIVVGAGYIGCSVAYHLSKAGLRVALFDQGGVAAGASRANYGNVQIQDAELGHSLPMITAGATRFTNLEDELGASVGYRRLGSLLLIETEAQWQTMAARLPALHAAGIAAEVIPAQHLPELEPQLNPRSLLGGCYYPAEGQVYPFGLLWAYLRQARRLGLTLHLHTPVIGFNFDNCKIRGVITPQGKFSTGTVILATGAWTPQFGQMFNREWQIAHVHGQALVTEAAPWQLQNHLASAAFFEDVESAESSGPEAVLAISQSAHGHLLLGEAAQVTDDLGSEATPAGQAAIARLARHALPAAESLRVLRGWAAPVAFTLDGLPYFGPVAGFEGLIVATAFKSTVIVTPLVGETVAQLVVSGHTELDLTPFAPERTVAHG